MSKSSTKRLFIALLPNADTRQTLAALLPQAIDGRRVPPQNIHATLAFLGDCTINQEACLRRFVASQNPPPMNVKLHRWRSWQPAGILCVTSDDVDTPLMDYVNRLRDDLTDLGFRLDKRRFVFHVTLARRFRGHVPDFPDRPMVWESDSVALMESVFTESGVTYRALEKNVNPRYPRTK
jgi:2'-5' RNA ligase